MQFNQIKFQSFKSRTYLGSPSIIRLLDGDLLVTHDYFGRGCPRNHEDEEHLTSVYRSGDNGKSWSNITHISNAYWSSLFVHHHSVYLIGVSQQYGTIVIRRSDDGGYTWTHPKDEKTGLLFKGGPYRNAPNYHCAPVPILMVDGRVYRAFEDCDPCTWGSGFQSLVVSADLESDMLVADSWTISNKVPFDPRWVPSDWGELERPGWLEGNVIENPEGEIWNILRFNSIPLCDRAAIIKVHDQGKNLSFDPQTGFIDFPGGMTKFSIRRDSVTGMYLSLVNNNTDANRAKQRNILSLSVSEDLVNWKVKHQLLADDSDLSWQDSLLLTGFQYVDWQFDGNDLIYVVRTAYDAAHNFHDSNRIIFDRLKDFRLYL